MPGRFDKFLIKMVAVEALQDPFMHMYSTDIDEENFKPMDVSNLNRYDSKSLLSKYAQFAILN